MAAGFVSVPVDTNGVTPVVVVDAPAAAHQRQILSCFCDNRDSIDHTYKGQKKKGATVINTFKVLVAAGSPPGQLISTGCLSLVATDETFVVFQNEATVTTESKIDPAVFEVP